MSRNGPRRAVAVDVVRQPNPLAAVHGESTTPTRLIPVVPLEGRQLIQPAQSFDFKMEGRVHVIEFVVDIPEDVDCDISFDGSVVLSANDRQGIVGSFRVGDFSGDSYLQADEVRVKGRNFGDDLLDVRVWVVIAA